MRSKTNRCFKLLFVYAKLKRTPFYFVERDVAAVHSGVNFKLPSSGDKPDAIVSVFCSFNFELRHNALEI